MTNDFLSRDATAPVEAEEVRVPTRPTRLIDRVNRGVSRNFDDARPKKTIAKIVVTSPDGRPEDARVKRGWEEEERNNNNTRRRARRSGEEICIRGRVRRAVAPHVAAWQIASTRSSRGGTKNVYGLYLPFSALAAALALQIYRPPRVPRNYTRMRARETHPLVLGRSSRSRCATRRALDTLRELYRTKPRAGQRNRRIRISRAKSTPRYIIRKRKLDELRHLPRRDRSSFKRFE